MGSSATLKFESDYALMTFQSDARKEIIPEIQKNILETSGTIGCKALLVDLSKAKTIDDSTMTELLLGAKKLKEGGMKLYVVKANPYIQSRIIHGGLDDTLLISEDIEQARSNLSVIKMAPPPKLKFDVAIINPFIEGAIKTLKIQAKVDSTPGIPFLKGQVESIPVDIVATLGIVSQKFNGSIALCFPKKLFLHIVNGMLGENYTDLNDDNTDAAGELLNIIFGSAKEALNSTGSGLQPAIPTVISGESLQMKTIMPEPTVVLPMNTTHGDYEIHIGIIRKP